MKKQLNYVITALLVGMLLLTGCSDSAKEYNVGEQMDVSTSNGDSITMTVKEAKELDEMQRISEGLSTVEGKAITIEFSMSAFVAGDSSTYEFRYRVKNQDGKWIDDEGYLERGTPFSLIQTYKPIFIVGEEDERVTFYAYNDKKVVGKVELTIKSAEQGESLEGYDTEAQLDALSIRLPNDYIVDDTGEPLKITSPGNELVIEAWHYTGAKGRDEKELAEEIFGEFTAEAGDIDSSRGAVSGTWNGRKWYDQYDYSESMKYAYVLTIEGDEYYVVRFSITLAGYGEVFDDVEIIKNLLTLQ